MQNNVPPDSLGVWCSHHHIRRKKGLDHWIHTSNRLPDALSPLSSSSRQGKSESMTSLCTQKPDFKAPILLWTTSEGSAKMIPSLHSSAHDNEKTSKGSKMVVASQYSKHCV